MVIDPRVGCSSISFRRLPLQDALRTIEGLGFTEIDLGALPGVCDHVPYRLDGTAVRDVSAVLTASPLTVRSINADVGDLDAELDDGGRARRQEHLDALVQLALATGATAVVLPCGAQGDQDAGDTGARIARVGRSLVEASRTLTDAGLELWVESLHYFRLCNDMERAALLTQHLEGSPVGVVMDFSHVVAAGHHPAEFVEAFADRIRHVHVRDARPGDIHLSVGRGQVDFAAGLSALAEAGYAGHYSLELETRDVADDERPAAAAAAGEHISALLQHP